MKSIVFFLFGMMAWANITFAQSPVSRPFKITGSIGGNIEIHQIWVNYGNDKRILIDVKNGRYSINGFISEPVVMHLQGYGKKNDDPEFDYKANSYDLYLVPGDVVLQSNKTLGNMQVSGTGAKWNRDFHYLAKQVALTADSISKLRDEDQNHYTKMVTYKRRKFDASYGIKEYTEDSIQFKKKSYLVVVGLDSTLENGILIPYIKKNPGSPVALWALMNMGGARKNIIYSIQAPLFELLLPEVKALNEAKMYKEKLEQTNATRIGRTAPVFTLPDTLGQSVSLSSLRGQYVLVDFWADWCRPCRRQFPHLRKVYDKYKGKGFVILGVSVSRRTSKASWKKAILQDEIHCLNVFDEKAEVAKQYVISSIPRNFLLDPNGKIIAVDLGSEEMEQKLKELLGE
jgi:peroxiredoxin